MQGAASRTTPRLQEDALDGMRGVAALLVVSSHLSQAGLHLVPGLDLAGIGKPGVYLFFVLSAFLLTRQVLSREPHELADRFLWLRYLARRVLRIFPLFSFVLVVSFLAGRFCGLALPFAISGPELLDHLTLRAGKDVLWSIPPEFQYYLVLPFVGAACVLLERRIGWVLTGAAVAIAWAASAWPGSLAVGNSYALGPYLPIFLIGSLAAVAHERLAGSPRWRRRRGLFEAAAAACALGVVLTIPSVFAAVSGQAVASDRFHGSRILYGALWSAFLIGTLLGTGRCRAALAATPARYLGFVSFSVYLWHMAVLRVVGSVWPGAGSPGAWLALGLTLALASASWLAIERPFLRLGAAWGARRRHER